MQWRSQRQSDNVEDQRGMSRALPIGGVGTIVLALVVYFLGGDPSAILNQGGGSSSPTTSVPQQNGGQQQGKAPADEQKQFVASVLGSTEDVWTAYFRQRGLRYRDPKLVLFSGEVESACGVTGASTGPFYCPNDEKLYLDTSFFHDMQTQLGAPGDFAEAYVIAHEVGHHVQKLLGTLDAVHKQEDRVSQTQANQLSVRTELQADFYAGVWAHYAREKGILDPGDVEEALNAASAVGDDRLQKETQGYVVPDSFTHGTSQQRAQWFKKGLDTGDIKQGNTFGNM